MPELYSQILDLKEKDVFLETEVNNNIYFNITGLPNILSYGKHPFSITFNDPEGRPLLKNLSNIVFEFVDSRGVVIFSNLIDIEELSGAGNGFIWIKKDPLRTADEIADGPAYFYVMGELGGKEIPNEWKGIYNVRSTFLYDVRKDYPNTSPIILSKPIDIQTNLNISESVELDNDDSVYKRSFINVTLTDLETNGGKIESVELAYNEQKAKTDDYEIVTTYPLISGSYETTDQDATSGLNPITNTTKIPTPKEFRRDTSTRFRLRFLSPSKQLAQYLDENRQGEIIEITSSYITFESSPIFIEKEDNLLTGSMFTGQSIESPGFEQAGKSSAFLRTFGYGGFTSASAGSGSGIMMWSGSVLGSETDDYENGGVGLELVSDSSSYFRYRSNPSELDIRADTFFVGSETSQFISGSGGNIEISSSLFHLDPSTGTLALSGSIDAVDGTIGGWNIESDKLVNVENTVELNSNTPGLNIKDGGGTERVTIKSGSFLTIGDGTQYIGNKSFEDDSISSGRNFVSSITSWSFSEAGGVNISLTDRSSYPDEEKAVSGDVTLDVVVPAGSGNYSSNNTYEIIQVITSSFTRGDTLSFSSVARFSSSFGGKGKDRALGPQYFRLEYSSSTSNGFRSFLPANDFTASNGYGEYFLGSGQYNSFGASAEMPEASDYVRLVLTGSINDDTGYTIKKPLFAERKRNKDLGNKTFNKTVKGSVTGEYPETELNFDNFSLRSNTRKVELTQQGLLIYNSEDSFLKMDASGIEFRGGSGVTAFGQSIARETFTNDSDVAGRLGAPSLQGYQADPEDISTTAFDGNVGDYAKGNHRHRITFDTINEVIGSNVLSVGGITTDGDIVAERYIVSSSVSIITQSFSSGSTIFGDSTDDTHKFTGSLSVTGSITGANLFITSSGQSVIQVGNNGETLNKWEWHRDGTRKWVIYNDGRTNGFAGQDSLVFKHGVVTDGDDHINFYMKPDDQNVYFEGNVTGSSTSTGSFGRIETAGAIRANDKIDINSSFAQLRLSDDNFNDWLSIGQSGTVGYIKTSDADNNFKFRRGSDNTDLLSIDFGNEEISLSGSVTASGDFLLEGSGRVAEYIYHKGDNDTYLRFAPNLVNLVAGGKSAIKYEASTGKIILNNTNENVDVHIMAEDNTELLATDAANNRVGINTTTPGVALEVVGQISASGNIEGDAIRSNGVKVARYRTDVNQNRLGSSNYPTVITGSTVTFGTSENMHLTASGNISASGDIFGVTGSFGNVRAGNLLADNHQFTGSVNITGSFLVNGGGVATTPGSDTEVVFNDGGSLGSEAAFTYDKTSNHLSASLPSTASFGLILQSGESLATVGGADTNVLINTGGVISGSNGFVYDDSTNRVGIGTDSPATVLNIVGGVGSPGDGIRIERSGFSSNYITIDSDSINTSVGEVRIQNDSGGGIVVGGAITGSHYSGSSTSTGSFAMGNFADKLGIGNTAPVSDNSLAAFIHVGSSAAGRAGIALEDNENKFEIFTTDSALKFSDGTDERMRLDNNGRLGIGETDPDKTLHVTDTGDTPVKIEHSDGTDTYIELRNNAGAAYIGSTTNDLSFRTEAAGNERLRITSTNKISGSSTSTGSFGSVVAGGTGFNTFTGNVGIGTTSPDAELQIMNNNGSSYRFGYGGTSDVYLDADNVYIRTDNGGANTATFTTTGLGIGTTAPGVALEVVGSISGSATSTGSFGQLTLPQNNVPSNPTLNFGDGDSGFYESSDDVIRIATAGNHYYSIHSAAIQGNASNRFGIQLVTPTSTLPTFTPNYSDTDTGIGYSGADVLSLIAGGVGVEVTSTGISGSSTSTGSFGVVTIGSANKEGVLNVVSNATSNPTNLPALNIDQDLSGAKSLFIATDTTTQSAIQAEANVLTTGRIARLYSNSDSTGTRNLVEIINDHTAATGTTLLSIQNDSTGNSIYVDQNGNGIALNIDHEGTNQQAINVNATNTSGDAVNIDADSLTTAQALRVASNSSDTNTRNVMLVHNDHASATGATALMIKQDSTGPAIVTQGGGYAISGSSTSTGSFGNLQAGDGSGFKTIKSNGIELLSFLRFTYGGGHYFEAGTNSLFYKSAAGATGFGMYSNGNTYTAGNAEVAGNISGSSTSTASFADGRFVGNVAIGTADPGAHNSATANLIVGDGADGSGLCVFNGTGTGRISFARGNNTSADAFDGGMSYNGDRDLKFHTNAGSTRMTIDASGFAGIGTDSPARILHVSTTAHTYIRTTSGGTAKNSAIEFTDGTNFFYSGLMANESGVSAGEFTIFGSNAAIVVEQAGDVKFGVANQKISGSSTSTGSFGVLKLAKYNQAYGTSDLNTFYGILAGGATTIATRNVAIGNSALAAEDVGDRSVAVGYYAMTSQNSDSDNEETGNTGVGYAAAYYNVTGQNNTYIGFKSGFGASGQSNNYNTAVGYNSLLKITDGGYNVALGSRSGEDLTTGDFNVFVGDYAGHSSVDVDRTVAIGHEAMGSGIVTSDGDGTIAIGYQTLAAMTSGQYNVAVGYQAMLVETQGDRSTAIGYQALKDQNGVNGEVHNTAVGYIAGHNITTGKSNTVLGSEAGTSLTTASQSVCIGRTAGNTISTGNQNIAVGFGAMSNNTVTGDNNISVGTNAGNNLTSGYLNIAIGYLAGDAITTGLGNVALGYEALSTAQAVTYATAIGAGALGDGNVTADANGVTAVGLGALKSLTSGGGNVAVGAYALDGITTSAQNTAVGYNALTACGDSYSNTAVGYQAGDSITNSGAFNVCIGTNADVSTGAAENQIVIGRAAAGHGNNIVVLGNTAVTAWHPADDNGVDLGSPSYRFADVFAVQTTVGGIFEANLKTKSIGDNPTGTIVVWEEDKLVPCDKSEDELVMGVIKNGKDEPIVLGAEPVLVTGKVDVGDYIVTSDKLGHGKSVKRGYLLKKDLFGKVIAQALESSDDSDSCLIKCMIRKM